MLPGTGSGLLSWHGEGWRLDTYRHPTTHAWHTVLITQLRTGSPGRRIRTELQPADIRLLSDALQLALLRRDRA